MRFLTVVVCGIALPAHVYGAEGTEQLRVRLSWGHRAAAGGPCFVKLVPASLEAMDWCLGQLEKAKKQSGTARGLVRGPLNDGTGEGYWAFSQAYLFAGLDLFGQALKRFGHPRADECLAAAAELRQAIDRALHTAADRYTVVVGY